MNLPGLKQYIQTFYMSKFLILLNYEILKKHTFIKFVPHLLRFKLTTTAGYTVNKM